MCTYDSLVLVYRYFLITGAQGCQQQPWGASTYAEDMDSSESGSLSKHFILEQCEEWTCTLESNTFISPSHSDVKVNLLKKSKELKSHDDHDTELSSPSKASWSNDTLTDLCSIYVSLFEKNVPPNVLFTKIMKNKKANIYTCPFACILFDKYILMQFPNYFHLMCSCLKDPMQVM